MYLVTNCYHWIGFHITNKLLQEGYDVVGVDPVENEQKEQMAMLFGRNSLFEHYDHVNEFIDSGRTVKLDAIISIGGKEDYLLLERIYAKKYLHLNKNGDANRSSEIVVELPLLYGEWMPREDKAFIHGDEFVRFDSKRFQQEAVYIEDFVGALFQLISSRNVPNQICFERLRKAEETKAKDNRVVFIRETNSIKTTLKQLDDHYQQFKNFY